MNEGRNGIATTGQGGVGLRPALGLSSAILLTVGSVIGSGIFMKPLRIAQALPGPEWVIAAWLLVGAICFAGGLAYAELGALFPRAGGQYTFLRESYGPKVAFLYGWCLATVINPGTIAALAVVFGDALASLLGRGDPAGSVLAMTMILVLAAVNHLGVGAGAVVQNVSTVAKIAVLFAIGAGGLFFASTIPAETVASLPPAPAAPSLAAGLAAAGVAIFWAYEGWHQIGFSAAEMKRPARDLPLGLLVGLGILVVLYAGSNLAYFAVIPHETLTRFKNPIDVPSAFFGVLFGENGARLFLVLLALSVFGAANPNLLSTPRSLYEMARQNELPPLFLRLSPRFRTPVAAIWVQAVMAGGLVLWLREFDDITDYVITVSLFFYAATVIGMVLLRKRSPDLPRPFLCPLPLLVAALFVAGVAFVLVNTLLTWEGQKKALIGAAFAATGLFLRRFR